MVSLPRGSAEPLSVATLLETPLGATVVTEGAPGVLNVKTVPTPVPTAFEAIAQK